LEYGWSIEGADDQYHYVVGYWYMPYTITITDYLLLHGGATLAGAIYCPWIHFNLPIGNEHLQLLPSLWEIRWRMKKSIHTNSSDPDYLADLTTSIKFSAANMGETTMLTGVRFVMSRLAIDTGVIATTSDEVALTNNLVVVGAAHALSSDGVTLTQHGVLAIASASHTLVSSVIALVQHHVLAVAGAAHTLSSDTVTLTAEEALHETSRRRFAILDSFAPTRL
jgi:hypothetical protein